MTQRIGHMTTAEHQAEVYKNLHGERERQVDVLCARISELEAENARLKRELEIAEIDYERMTHVADVGILALERVNRDAERWATVLRYLGGSVVQDADLTHFGVHLPNIPRRTHRSTEAEFMATVDAAMKQQGDR